MRFRGRCRSVRGEAGERWLLQSSGRKQRGRLHNSLPLEPEHYFAPGGCSRQKNICSASLTSVRGTFQIRNGLKWKIVPAFVAMEDYFGKER